LLLHIVNEYFRLKKNKGSLRKGVGASFPGNKNTRPTLQKHSFYERHDPPVGLAPKGRKIRLKLKKEDCKSLLLSFGITNSEEREEGG